ncbi:hypothetical protein KFE25_011965 [Diacronema lutheri]|uniref:DUF3456 domain-containing protein n=2 Tax=Diacronema lutheri TaxID=2081491 RepID=A0A8J6C1V6_DIALT|nr:hypothetical protein KFE25_011965 [Diacronema lutheri]
MGPRANFSPLVLTLLGAAGGAAETPASPPPAASARCVACALLTSALADALAATKAELDQFREAKEEAIGRVQKAQTRRWLKQEYGSSLYAGVEDAMDKVCALPALTAHVRRCEAIREEREDALVRATLDGTAAAFCAAAVRGCTAEDMAGAMASARRAADEVAAEPAAAKVAPKGGATAGATGGAVAMLSSAALWERHVLDGARDVLVYVHATVDGAAAHKRAPLWVAFERLARAVRQNGALNGTLSCARLDLSRTAIALPDALFDGDDDAACAPAVVLYAAAAKETPRALVASCDGASAGDGEARRADGDGDSGAGGGADADDDSELARVIRGHGARLVDGLHTFVTASSKPHVLALGAKLADAAVEARAHAKQEL